MEPLTTHESALHVEQEGEDGDEAPDHSNNLPPPTEPAPIQKLNKQSGSLEYLLGQRSTPRQLLQQNIMHGGVRVAPAIQHTQRALRFQQTVDALDHKLLNRPNKEQLITNNIIRSKSADNLQARQVALKFQRAVDKLDPKIAHRPSFHQLQAQNIIKMGIAPSLYATQQQLKFTQTAETLDHKLTRRPPRSVLIASNIVRGNEGIAPSISAAQQELRFHTIADTLDHKIVHRPTAEALVDQNIMKERGVHPLLQSTQQALKFSKTKSQVGHKMHSRPSKGSLVEQNILFNESPFLRETKKKLIRRRVSSSLSSRLEHRPSREEFDLRFRYYFTDSDVDTASSYADSASCADTASNAGDVDEESGGVRGMLRAKSMPNCSFAPPPTIHEEDESSVGDEEEEEKGEGEEEGGIPVPGGGRRDEIYDHDYYEQYADDFRSADDSIDTSLLSSSI